MRRDARPREGRPVAAADQRPFADAAAVRRLANSLAGRKEPDGRAGPGVADELQAFECSQRLTPAATRAYLQLLAHLGLRTGLPVGLPLDDTPYWLRGRQPLAGHRSRPALPDAVDVLVVGAGLTGASTAYHLAAAAQDGLRVAVVDRGDPAGEASGRNGGHFETIPENSVGLYEGLATERGHFLRRRHPSLPPEVLAAEAERQASVVLRFALRNRQLLRTAVHDAGIECDFSPRGWVFLTHTDREEQAVCDEVVLAAEHGERIELWSRAKVRAELGFATEHLARFVPGDGSYHPFKLTCGLLERALRCGVELYTRLPVLALVDLGNGHHRVETAEGAITAGHLVLATNAFTSELLPELRAITPRQSQVTVTEHVPDRMRGRIATTEEGPLYFNQPRGGAKNGRAPLLFGGGDDRPMVNPSSRRRSARVHRLLLEHRDRLFPELAGQPPSSEWVGPIAFTPDQLPVVGLLRRGVIVAAGFNGYGGSYCMAAGEAAAALATTGRSPDWLAEDVFAPARLLADEPLFLRRHDSLWRIADSLCSQLRAVTDELADALLAETPSTNDVEHLVGAPSSPSDNPADPPTPEELVALSGFAGFDLAEGAALLAALQPRSTTDGEVLWREGDEGGFAILVVRGQVEVAIRSGREPRVLSVLGPGTTLGQISLFQGTSRTATCTARGSGLLLVVDRPTGDQLLSGRSPAALTLLSLLNRDLIAALRKADRRLLRLRAPSATEPPSSTGGTSPTW